MQPITILFVHQNMPGQFRHLAAELAKNPAYRVIFLTRREGVTMPGIITARYPFKEAPPPPAEPLVRSIATSVHFGTAVAKAAVEMTAKNIVPDLIIAHPGWGEALFLRDAWPDAKIVTYAEYYYRPYDGDIGFDPLFPRTLQGVSNARIMNANLLLSHEAADAMISPTHWQKSRHPQFLQDKTSVIFDGIDTDRAAPRADASFVLADGQVLTAKDEVITYVARNLEPHRGFHVFVEALPKLLAARPNAQIVVVGGDERSYSPPPRGGHTSWRSALMGGLDLGQYATRLHFVGKLAYADYLSLLQISGAHLYLTYPFVLSWSCLEAMSAGCAIVASDTAPVSEVLSHEQNGLLFPFFDSNALVASVSRILDDPALSRKLRTAARHTAVTQYNLADCLKQQMAFVHKVLEG
ncbi:glycosyltransferase [Novosphingobium sp. AAP83]|uniref:glycosyltransferase n=1 Tax=Novosphingobium sp. AAP83 TaxID=1523425 RepID=UPI0006B9FC54|nr:glycosyltransferase [Novosphingobium sp. AAP83]